TNHSALWCSLFPPYETAILHLGRRSEPALNIEQHPRAVGMFTDRPHQQMVLDAVEEGLDVQVQNPCVTPAALAGYSNRFERRFAGPVSIGVVVELGFT